MSAPAAPVSPRVARVARLAAELATAYAEGDVEGARVLHEAIGKLLSAPAPVVPQSTDGDADVVGLADERRKRRL